MEFVLQALPSIVSALTVAGLGALFALLKKVLKRLEANNDATRYILKERILHMCRKYQKEGYIPSFEAEVLQELRKEYRNLGGNSFISSQVDKTLCLPLVKEEEN